MCPRFDLCISYLNTVIQYTSMCHHQFSNACFERDAVQTISYSNADVFPVFASPTVHTHKCGFFSRGFSHEKRRTNCLPAISVQQFHCWCNKIVHESVYSLLTFATSVKVTLFRRLVFAPRKWGYFVDECMYLYSQYISKLACISKFSSSCRYTISLGRGMYSLNTFS